MFISFLLSLPPPPFPSFTFKVVTSRVGCINAMLRLGHHVQRICACIISLWEDEGGCSQGSGEDVGVEMGILLLVLHVCYYGVLFDLVSFFFFFFSGGELYITKYSPPPSSTVRFSFLGIPSKTAQ